MEQEGQPLKVREEKVLVKGKPKCKIPEATQELAVSEELQSQCDWSKGKASKEQICSEREKVARELLEENRKPAELSSTIVKQHSQYH